MPLVRDIAATYRSPSKVMTRLLGEGVNEPRTLAILIAGCVVAFVSTWPRLAREAHITEQDLNPMLGGSLLAWVMIAPLMFYALAFVIYLVAKAFTRQQSPHDCRLILYWAFLAASPVMLLYGLVTGFIGAGVQATLIGAIWCTVFFWFLISGLWAAPKRVQT